MTTPPPDSNPAPPAAYVPSAPLDGFTADEFLGRRDRLRASCPDGLIVIRGAAEDDFPHGVPFQQDSTFFYFTGIDTPGAVLALLPAGVLATAGVRDADPGVREFLFLPARNPATEAWTGPQLGPGAETERLTGIARVMDVGGLTAALIGWIRRNPLVYTLTPYGEKARQTPDGAFMEHLSSIAPVARFLDVASHVARLRVVKSSDEIARIRDAIRITAEGQRVARSFIEAGADHREYEVEAKIFEAFRRRGADLAFSTIVGSGIYATVLHYEANCHLMQEGDLVVVDIGARSGHYCGDLTRTYAVGGKASARQQEVHTLVLAAHEQAVTGFQPGVDTLGTLNDRCKAFLKASSLRAKDALRNERTMDTFMPHRLGHHLGLDVHDVGDAEPPLSPGNVITIEPGIYIPSESLGVRIEDDYLVTIHGLERLGPALPKDLLLSDG